MCQYNIHNDRNVLHNYVKWSICNILCAFKNSAREEEDNVNSKQRVWVESQVWSASNDIISRSKWGWQGNTTTSMEFPLLWESEWRVETKSTNITSISQGNNVFFNDNDYIVKYATIKLNIITCDPFLHISILQNNVTASVFLSLYFISCSYHDRCLQTITIIM